MVIKKLEHKNITEEKCLNEILDIKKKDYIRNIFVKCSAKEKQIFIKRSLINYSSLPVFCSVIGVFMSSIGITGFNFMSSMYFIIPTILGLFMIGVSQLPFIQNKLINMWMSENKNVDFLQNEMFKETVVDKDVLKSFVKNYSERQLVILLNEKEALTYKDIYFYIANENKYREIDKKTINLSKAVKCLSD